VILRLFDDARRRVESGLPDGPFTGVPFLIKDITEQEREDVENMTWLTTQYGREATAADYARSVQMLHRAGRAVGRFFQQWDILLTPTMCNPLHKLGAIDTMTDDTHTFEQVLFSTIAFTSVFNATGNPAMSVPLHWTKDGLPVGVQFAAPFGEESTLFRLAAQLEAAQPWGRSPPLTLTVARKF
jgi:amidase